MRIIDEASTSSCVLQMAEGLIEAAAVIGIILEPPTKFTTAQGPVHHRNRGTKNGGRITTQEVEIDGPQIPQGGPECPATLATVRT